MRKRIAAAAPASVIAATRSAPVVSAVVPPAIRTMAGLAVAVVLLAGCGGAPTRDASGAAPATSHAPAGQTEVQFTGLHAPNGVAVDVQGNVYVSDAQNHRVVKLDKAGTQTVLPFTGLRGPGPLAVDKDGNVYVADHYWPSQIWKLPAGSSTPVMLANTAQECRPEGGGCAVEGLSTDDAGNLYVSEQEGCWYDQARVFKMDAPVSTASHRTTLSFNGLHLPMSPVEDKDGNVYVIDHAWKADPAYVAQCPPHPPRVLKLTPSGVQTDLPFTSLQWPQFGLAVDGQGNVYVSNLGLYPTFNTVGDRPMPVQVLKLTPSGTQTVLPFEGLNWATYMAVAPDGALYLSDTDNNRVLKLGIS